MFLGSYSIGDYVSFTCATHNASGNACAADAAPAYRIYEEADSTLLLSGSMSAWDTTVVSGLYYGVITPTSGAGFEMGKSYIVHISAAVGGVTGSTLRQFQLGTDLNLTQTLGASGNLWYGVTVGDSLKSAWVENQGKWSVTGTTLTLYAPDGITVWKTFTLDSATTPTQRS